MEILHSGPMTTWKSPTDLSPNSAAAWLTNAANDVLRHDDDDSVETDERELQEPRRSHDRWFREGEE